MCLTICAFKFWAFRVIITLQWFFHVHFRLLWKSTSVPQASPFTPLNGILISLSFCKEYFGFFRKRKMGQNIWGRKVKWETGESLMLKQHVFNFLKHFYLFLMRDFLSDSRWKHSIFFSLLFMSPFLNVRRGSAFAAGNIYFSPWGELNTHLHLNVNFF